MGGNHLFIVFVVYLFFVLLRLLLFCDCLDVSLLGWLVVASCLGLFVHIVFYCSSTFSQLPDTHLFVLTSSLNPLVLSFLSRTQIDFCDDMSAPVCHFVCRIVVLAS